MGGDFAPSAVVAGAVAALNQLEANQKIVLFGDETKICSVLEELNTSPSKFEIVNCTEVIEMGDNPAKAIAKKPDSSIAVGFKWLASGKIDGFASAGNTGAMLVGAVYSIKVIPGIIRPAIAGYIPVGETKFNLILDVGINPDCRPDVLYQYALLGSFYSKHVLGNPNPRIALLNIGEEEEKGNLVTKGAFELMKETAEFNFVGNVEGSDLFSDKKTDVVVCDGFVGNVVLKQAEAFYRLTKKRNCSDPYFDRFNFENYGGTPILGVNAPVIIGHGVSKEKAIMNMILQTREVIATNLCTKIKEAFK